VIEHYLSAGHLDAPGIGCPLAALASEIARQPSAIRERINQSMLGYCERMLRYIPARTDTDEDKRARVFILFSEMAGVLVAARALILRGDFCPGQGEVNSCNQRLHL
jgi:TetR/AcrR family transcriptional repressor of nem operon